MQASLTANDLSCRRGDRLLFRGFSMTLENGASAHITGGNGVGKTTLLRAIAGLLTPFAGEIKLHGGVGLLDERNGLDPDLPLRKALRFWEKIDRCHDPMPALKAMGVDGLLDVPVRYLSTGQRKRAAFASLMNRNVPVWLLDEPLSGLDNDAMAQMQAIIEQHLADGGIALIASHQPVSVKGIRAIALEDFAP